MNRKIPTKSNPLRDAFFGAITGLLLILALAAVMQAGSGMIESGSDPYGVGLAVGIVSGQILDIIWRLAKRAFWPNKGSA